MSTWRSPMRRTCCTSRTRRGPGARSTCRRASSSTNIPMIAVDSRGRPHIAIGQQSSRSRVSYAHKQAGRWRVEDVSGHRACSPASWSVMTVSSRSATQTSGRATPMTSASRIARCPLGFHVRSVGADVGRTWPSPGRVRGVRHRCGGATERAAFRHAALVARVRPHMWLTRSWKRAWAGPVGSIIDPVRSQWIAVRGDTTYLFYRGVDGATWMVEGRSRGAEEPCSQRE